MHAKLSFLSAIFISIAFFACEKNKPKKETPAYFDLKSYFEKQESLLEKNKFRLKKFVSQNGVMEEKQFDSIDWREELKPFAECDLNKPSWRNAFTTDSSFDNGILSVKNEAKDSSLKIKKINFCFEHNSITLINIEKRTGNLYYDYLTTLNYFPMKGYSISTSQKITFTKETAIEVKALFIR